MNPIGTHLVAEFISCQEKILNQKDKIEKILKKGIEKSGFNLKGLYSYQFQPLGITSVAIIGESHIIIHTYPEANHLSLDIFTCSGSKKQIYTLLEFLKNEFKPEELKLTELLRGNSIEIKQEDWLNENSQGTFEVKYHIKKHLLSKKTKYQKIDIIENEDFGRMLFLDNDLQIAEKDAQIYNKSLVSPVTKLNNLNKVAILGGGDGGVLYELLKYNPKEVFLGDIDAGVIKASKEFLECIHHNSFNIKNVKIIIDDANDFLETNNGFDAIIYDLTMNPELLTEKDKLEFLNELFSKIRKSLNKEGIISLQCCSEHDKETMNILKNMLSKYFKNIHFEKVFIPSFCEEWIFASAKKQ